MMENSSSNSSKGTKRQSTTAPIKCKICRAPAIYSYFGAIACQSCKVFFKRHAQRGQGALKCYSDGHCEINLHNRRVCPYCRLVKCFASGMQSELIRSSRTKSNKTNKKRKEMADPIETTTSRALIRLNESEQFPTLNLLQSDQSTLTIEQWNLISNLIQCYDEYSGLLIGKRYMHEQKVLPLKLRFKPASLKKYFLMALEATQSVYKNNQDFLSLPADDRSILLHNTMKYTGIFSVNCISNQIGLLNCDAYYHIIKMIVHPDVAPTAKRVADRVDFDMIIMKLILAILSFSTINYTVYSNSPPINFSNIKQILHIQNTYIELTWKYLLYKYKFELAVKCFSNLIGCMFAVHDAVVTIQNIPWFEEKIDSIVQEIVQTVITDD